MHGKSFLVVIAERVVCASNSYILIISAIPGHTCEEAVLDNPCGDFTICVSVEGVATCSCNQTGYELQTDTNCTGKYTPIIFGEKDTLIFAHTNKICTPGGAFHQAFCL